MKNIFKRFTLALLIVALVFPGTSIGQQMKPIPYEGKNYLIGFKERKDPDLIRKHNGKTKYLFENLPVITAQLTAEQAERLSYEPEIDYVEPDYKTKLLSQKASWGISRVNADISHQNGLTGKNVRIGVLDTGIDLEHEDLIVVGGVSFISGTSHDDDNGHGTHVAGILAAQNNSIGVLGVAPDASLYSIKVLNSYGSGTYSDLIAGIDWAIENQLDIINISLGGTNDSKALKRAVDQAYKSGVLIIAAAGNEGYSREGSITYPAKYKAVIAVGSIDQDELRDYNSSVGKELELVAPGVGIYSTLINGYGYNMGTSMAAPHVAGVAALHLEENPHLLNKQVRKLLNTTAKPLGDDYEYGSGLVRKQ